MFLNFISPNKNNDQITTNVLKSIKKLAKTTVKEKFWITHYGANDIHPKYLVIWICVKTDIEKNRLSSDINLSNMMRNILIIENYPEEGRSGVFIGFESQETVDRESDGDWSHHWK